MEDAVSDLIRNPHASISLVQGSDAPAELQIRAPLRGKGLKTTVIGPRSHPLLFESLYTATRSARGPVSVRLKPTDVAILREAGYLVPSSQVSSRPRFSCRLGEGALDAPGAADTTATLQVVTGFKLLLTPPKSARLRHQLAQLGLQDTFPLAVVKEPTTGMSAIYEVPDWLVDACSRLHPGKAMPRLRAKERAALAAARVLVQPEALRRERAMWRHTCDSARILLHHRGYVNVPGLLPEAQRLSLRAYYRALVHEGFLALGDNQSLRFKSHNDAVSKFFHEQLSAVVSELFGTPSTASYCYLGCYQPGAALARHVDRKQCKFSGSLLVDFEPSQDGRSTWPIVFAPRRKTPGVLYQALGDCVFYHGCDIPHGRPRLPDGCYSSSLFIHYVPRTFRGPLD